MPVARLFKAVDVSHGGGGSDSGERPAILSIDRQGVLAGEQDKALGTDLLIKIPGQSERKLRCERKNAPQAVAAETVGLNARAQRHIDVEAVLQRRKRVGEERTRPKKMRADLDPPIVVET